MSTIKSQHRKAVGICTVTPPATAGGKPRKVWRYTMSLKNFARECERRGSLPALRWMGNKGMRTLARVHHGP